MRLSKREMILLTVLLIAGSIYLYYNYLYIPITAAAQSLNSENEKLQINLLEAEKRKQNQKRPADAAKKLIADYQVMLAKVPEDPYVPEMIVYLSEAARQTRVELKKIDYKYEDKPNPAAQPAGDGQAKKTGEQNLIRSSQLEVEAQGTYYDLLAFMLKLENAPRIYVLTHLDLSSSKRKPPEITPDSSGAAGAATSTGITTGPEQILVGSATYDGNSIVLKLKFQSFFDQITSDNMKGVSDPVIPNTEGKNPFS